MRWRRYAGYPRLRRDPTPVPQVPPAFGPGVPIVIKSIELNVWEFNQAAIEFYRALGYEIASHKMNMPLR